MTTFKEKLEMLCDKLLKAINEEEPVKQCQILSKSFGDDFPLLEHDKLYKEQKSFVPYSSASGM